MSIELRPLEAGDLARVVALNNAAHPAVPLFDEGRMAELVAIADEATVAVRDGRLAGFIVTVAPGSAYDSENYRYFADRAADTGRGCLYIDRIVIDESARGSGLGRRLYDAVFARAVGAGLAEVTCEVNIDPPNPESLAFHARLGFERIGEQPTKDGSVVVALLAAPVAEAV